MKKIVTSLFLTICFCILYSQSFAFEPNDESNQNVIAKSTAPTSVWLFVSVVAIIFLLLYIYKLTGDLNAKKEQFLKILLENEIHLFAYKLSFDEYSHVSGWKELGRLYEFFKSNLDKSKHLTKYEKDYLHQTWRDEALKYVKAKFLFITSFEHIKNYIEEEAPYLGTTDLGTKGENWNYFSNVFMRTLVKHTNEHVRKLLDDLIMNIQKVEKLDDLNSALSGENFKVYPKLSSDYLMKIAKRKEELLAIPA